MKLYKPFQFLTAAECDSIISYGRGKIESASTLGKSSVRNNRVVWYEDSKHWQKWIDSFNQIENRIDWIQTPQISFYKPGEHYHWHTDSWPKYRTHIRHFTLTCELQNAVGGNIEVENLTIPKLKKGEALVFKSHDRHRATSPIEGERISFTIWAMALNPNKR